MLTDNLPLSARVHKKEMHTIMKITLRERTAETTAIYFRKASTPQIRRTLPQKAKTLAEALEDFEATRLFLLEIIPKYNLHTIGAFTYADNLPSVKVLEKNHFTMVEALVEDGVSSEYYEFSSSL